MLKNLRITSTAAIIFLASYTTATASPESTSSSSDIGMQAAIEAALKHSPGRVLEAEMEREDGKPAYEIEIVQDDKITEVNLDAATAKVITTKTDDLKMLIKEFLISDKKLNALKTAKVSLQDAVIKAEAETKGKVLEAEFEREDGVYVYEMELKSEDKRVEILVDASTGLITRD